MISAILSIMELSGLRSRQRSPRRFSESPSKKTTVSDLVSALLEKMAGMLVHFQPVLLERMSLTIKKSHKNHTLANISR